MYKRQLYGDVPLTRVETLQPLVDTASQGKLALLTVQLANPSGYGRIVRDGPVSYTHLDVYKRQGLLLQGAGNGPRDGQVRRDPPSNRCQH